jgi:hypothetical protein
MEVAITSTRVIEGYAYFNAIAFYPIVSTFGASLGCFGGLAFYHMALVTVNILQRWQIVV